MTDARPTFRRVGSAERVDPHYVFRFDVDWPDGRRARVIAVGTRGGLVLDLQAETVDGFRAGTTGDPNLDAAIREHVRGFARGSTPRRPVIRKEPRP